MNKCKNAKDWFYCFTLKGIILIVKSVLFISEKILNTAAVLILWPFTLLGAIKEYLSGE